MKYIVTATSFLRIDTNEYRFNDFVRDEVIDTKTNPLFQDCLDAFEVEDRYEEFWNRLNANYNNPQISLKFSKSSLSKTKTNLTKRLR